ncbi:MAG: type II toxin-antitoxin system VapC family toxin [Leucobacter sp.]
MLAYLDTSALVKLVDIEAETSALETWLAEHEARIITSSLTLTELPRAIRHSNPVLLSTAYDWLRACAIVNLDSSLFECAARIDPPLLRSLDALHLAAAIHLGGQLDAFVSYDHRLIEAARQAGLRTASPGTAE